MNRKLKYFLDNSNFRKDRTKKKNVTIVHKKEKASVQEEMLTVKDGQIVINEENMYMDIHKHVGMEVMEDDRIITSSTFSKRKGILKWTKKEMELFYKALEVCGIEFSLISSLFPNRDRKHIKAKYIKEAKKNPLRIDEALKGHGMFDQTVYNKLKNYISE